MRSLFLLAAIFCCFHFAKAQSFHGAFAYTFKDTTTVAERQRNYLIEVSESSVHFIIDQDENVLLDEKYTVTTKQFMVFRRKLKSCKLTGIVLEDLPKECNPDMYDTFFFLWDENSPQDGFMYKCNGKKYNTIKGKIDQARKLFISMVPDFSNKLKSTFG